MMRMAVISVMPIMAMAVVILLRLAPNSPHGTSAKIGMGGDGVQSCVIGGGGGGGGADGCGNGGAG